jgi:aminopeptidase N
MQEDNDQESVNPRQSRLWIAALIILSVVGLACGAIALLLLFTTDAPQIPTIVARVSVILPTPGQQDRPVGSPTPQTIPSDQPPLLPQAGGRSAGDPYAPELGNAGYDIQHYTLQLALDPADDFVQGATTIEALSTVSGLSEMTLDFAGFKVGAVTVDGIVASFARDGYKLIVALPELKGVDEPFSIVVSYRGRPTYEPSAYLQFVDHLGLHYPDGESIFVIAEPDGARYWFPANDHPRDKATFRFEVAVPAGLTAVANGKLQSSEPAVLPGGTTGELYVWEHQHAMAPYLAFVGVGSYERMDARSPGGVPLRSYFFPELREELVEATSEVGEAIDWMADLFGPYPFERFGYVTAHIPGGSMETQTLVLLSSGMIGKRTAVHELAHMWFGDWVSLDSWEEMWRNEGFATYVQLMWETNDDPEEMALRIAALQSVVDGNDKSYPLNHPPPEYLFELNIYFQGAVAVHALREEMGDEAFFDGLRHYFQRFGGKTASDADFRAVMEESAGRSLETYFSEWFPPV